MSDNIGKVNVAELIADRDRLRSELASIKQVLVEATMEPFDVGRCVVCGPIESRDLGKPVAVTEHVLEGVFSQLLQRVEDKARSIVDDVNRQLDELADLRAYKERTEAGLVALSAKYAESVHERYGGVVDDGSRLRSVVRSGIKDLGLWRDPPQAEVQP